MIPLPGIESFQILGDARPGSTLRACGYQINGATLCVFQVLYLTIYLNFIIISWGHTLMHRWFFPSM